MSILLARSLLHLEHFKNYCFIMLHLYVLRSDSRQTNYFVLSCSFFSAIRYHFYHLDIKFNRTFSYKTCTWIITMKKQTSSSFFGSLRSYFFLWTSLQHKMFFYLLVTRKTHSIHFFNFFFFIQSILHLKMLYWWNKRLWVAK